MLTLAVINAVDHVLLLHINKTGVIITIKPFKPQTFQYTLALPYVTIYRQHLECSRSFLIFWHTLYLTKLNNCFVFICSIWIYTVNYYTLSRKISINFNESGFYCYQYIFNRFQFVYRLFSEYLLVTARYLPRFPRLRVSSSFAQNMMAGGKS